MATATRTARGWRERRRNVIDLKPFCGRGRDNPQMSRTWVFGAREFACDGKVIIWIPSLFADDVFDDPKSRPVWLNRETIDKDARSICDAAAFVRRCRNCATRLTSPSRSCTTSSAAADGVTGDLGASEISAGRRDRPGESGAF